MMEDQVLLSVEDDNAFFKSFLDAVPARISWSSIEDGILRQQDSSNEMEDETEAIKKNQSNKKKKKHFDSLQGKTDSNEAFMSVKAKKQKNKPRKKPGKVGHESGNSIESLREKLQARIEELQGKRGTLTSEELQEKKRLIRKERKINHKKKLAKNKNAKIDQPGVSSCGGPLNGANSEKKSPPKPVFNKDGRMVFSKFDFSASGETVKHRNKFKGKDYERLLKKVEQQKEKVEKLKEKDVEAANCLEEKTAWLSVLSKAEGEKVKDNPELLRKAAKKKEKMSKKKEKMWKERVQQTKKRMEEKQKKRQKNIEARKQTVKDNKRKKAIKKGRLIPGF